MMIGDRIRELRVKRGLQQRALGIILGTTQQNISKIENGHCDVPNDLLVQIAKYFDVTTDYLLGLSDIKRDIACQMHISQDMEQYYDLFLRYKNLNNTNRKTFHVILERLEESQVEIK